MQQIVNLLFLWLFSSDNYHMFGWSTWQKQTLCPSSVKGSAMLSSTYSCIQLHIQVQLRPWQQANAEGIPGIQTSWKHSSNCVYLCVYMLKCASRLNWSNMWAQLESRHLFYPLLHWLKFQSQKEHNMNFLLFSWGTIKLHKVKQNINNVMFLQLPM